jgi:acetoacetyl-CoA synthetase
MNDLLWSPSKKKIKNSNLYQFKNLIEKKYKISFKTNYQKLWEWSVKNDDIFWSECWDFFNLKGFKGKQIIKNHSIFQQVLKEKLNGMNYMKNFAFFQDF